MKAGFHSPVAGTGADAPDTRSRGAEPEEVQVASFTLSFIIWKIRINFGWNITRL